MDVIVLVKQPERYDVLLHWVLPIQEQGFWTLFENSYSILGNNEKACFSPLQNLR
jgi:hypothetical protein